MRQKFSAIFPLCPGRAHEVTGPGAASLALSMAGIGKGPVMWISEQRLMERLHPGGVARFCDPARILFSFGKTRSDTLWIAEEALRSGAIPLVITALMGDIDLTSGRRLQLAAEAGRATGVFLLPQDMGSNAAETRWYCTPVCDSANQDSTLFEWRCIKNKSGTNGSWLVNWNGATHHIDLVSQTGKPTHSQAKAG